MMECVIFGRGRTARTVYKCLGLLEEYKLMYFVDSDVKNSGVKWEGVEFITPEELIVKDIMKKMKVIIADESRDEVYRQILKLGYSEDDVIIADDIINKVFNKEYEKFLQKYEFIGENMRITVNAPQIAEDLEKADFEVLKYRVDKDDYDQYLSQANYQVEYPEYIEEFKESLPGKTFQHYVSYKLLDMKKDDVYMDVASSNSVFPYIAEKICQVKTFKQDISYKWGVNGNRIGSYASSIPMPDNSIDYMALHCSLEHFEGNEDFLFIKEAHRLLSVKGKVCIIPLYLADEYVIMTSPKVWIDKYSVYIKAPEFDPRARISINDSIRQRQSKHFSVQILKEELLDKFSDKFNIKIYFIENFREFERAKPFVLVLEKI